MAVQIPAKVNLTRLVISPVVIAARLLLVLLPVLLACSPRGHHPLAAATRTAAACAFSHPSPHRHHRNSVDRHRRNNDAGPSFSSPVSGWKLGSGSSLVSLLPIHRRQPRRNHLEQGRVPIQLSLHPKATTSRMTASDAVVEDSSASASASAPPDADVADKDSDRLDGDSEEDPYLWLEEVESERSLAFARETNDACLAALGDPTTSGTGTYDRVLRWLESDDRIPHSGKYGRDDEGEEVLYNFWKDGKNPKGIWRRTTLSSFRTDEPDWTTVLDLDELGRKENTSWVWKGAKPLPRPRDPPHKGGCDLVNRALLFLSRGGADATVVREFDLTTNDFVHEKEAFNLPEAKTRAGYKSRDVLLVGSDFGPGSLTDSGYPRTVREWVRGTPVEDAPTVFEGESGDVSVSSYIDDQRNRSGGCLYEVRQRALTFYTSRQWVRKIEAEHLLPPDDPDRVSVAPPPDFVELDIQRDADFDLFGNLLLVSLRSDWTVGGVTFQSGSLLYTEYDSFISGGKDGSTFEALFEPTERTALETYSATKNFLILSVMDNVKSKLVFFRLEDADEAGGSRLVNVGGDDEARIRSTHAGCLDSYEGDKFWFTTSGYTQPSTLHLADASLVATAVAKKGGDGGDGALGDESSSPTDDAYVIERLKFLPDQYDSSDVEVVQRTAISRDGTRVPYFVAMKRGTKMDGNTPTLLYGYGGFEISLSPHYIATQGIAWLERGGAYVEANIRGGGEFGPTWHQAALKENRNKCYEDYIAIAEDLCASGLCKPSTLGIRGGSNGGLLMGNMLVMRPDLFGAIHCAVPLLDMKRYHILLAGASWMAEYGDPSTDDWDDFLYRYSPYHNIDPKADYPPILFTTSTRDDRVHPAHARKMVARLVDVGKGRWPVHYYENIEGGHGGAADSKQSAFMTSLAYDFLWNTLSKEGRTARSDDE